MLSKQKKFAAKKKEKPVKVKVVDLDFTPQGMEYWETRSSKDKKKDWNESKYESWIEGYWQSYKHTHRFLLAPAIRKLVRQPDSILEVGCSAAPNIRLLEREFPMTKLAGIDINADSIRFSQSMMNRPTFMVGSVFSIPFYDKSFDVVFADAVLMYVAPIAIRQAIGEMVRIAKKGIVLIDWYDEARDGIIKDFHWARNYPSLFESEDWKTVVDRPLTLKDWPTESWARNGHLFVFKPY